MKLFKSGNKIHIFVKLLYKFIYKNIIAKIFTIFLVIKKLAILKQKNKIKIFENIIFKKIKIKNILKKL